MAGPSRRWRALRGWLSILALAFGAPAAIGAGDPPVHDAYALTDGSATDIAVDVLHLEMDALDAEALFRKPPTDKSSFPVTLRDGERRLSGRVEVKGSFSRNFLKKSLLVMLPKGEEWNGHRRLALNAMATDPTQAREWLVWDLARRLGLAIPDVRYRHLYVNGEYIGLYLDIEWMDATMFARLGLGEGGDFLQPEDSTYCGDLTPASLAPARECWRHIQRNTESAQSFEAMLHELQEVPVEHFDAWLERNFDSHSVLAWLVLNAVTQNGDTYNKNYFLHRSPRDAKWRVIPWDYDLAWGRVADPAVSFPRMIFNDNFQYAFPVTLGADNPLKDKALANRRLFERYRQLLRTVLEGAPDHPAGSWYAPGNFRARLADLKALTAETVRREKFPVADAQAVDEQFEALAFFNAWRYHYLRAQVLDPSPFDTLRWTPWQPYEPLNPLTPAQLLKRRSVPLALSATASLPVGDGRLAAVEPLIGWPLAMVRPRDGALAGRVRISVEREAAPRHLPPGLDGARCIERSWLVTAEADRSARVDLELDYLQESSTRHEIGAAIGTGTDAERRLGLWRFDGERWTQLSSRVNPFANLIHVVDLELLPYRNNLLVACAAPVGEVRASMQGN